MRLQLSDTTSDAIRFLLIGAGSLFILRLAYAGISRSTLASDPSELEARISEFQNGYLLSDQNTLVTDGMGVGERIALALVVAAILASVVALVVYMLLRASGRPGGPVVVGAARITLILSLLWFTYAALLLPPRTARFLPAGIVLTHRPAALGELSLPWPGTTSNYDWSTIDGVEVAASESGQVKNTELVAVHGMDLLLLTTSLEPEGDQGRVLLLADALRAAYLKK